MKGIWIHVALALLMAPGSLLAETTTVICDGCGESEYRQTALRAANANDSILVVDAQNAQLRKYIVSSFESYDGGMLQKTALLIAPTQDEWAAFAQSVDAYDRFVSATQACGPGFIGDLLIPDFGLGWACDQHDRCYERGGDEPDRDACDRQFYFDLRLLGATHEMAAAYYLAVRSGGWMFFKYRSNRSASGNPLLGCNFLIVCDYTATVKLPG